MNKNAEKEKLKKVIKIIIIAFASLGILLLILYGISELMREKTDLNNVSSSDINFFEVDYDEDILEDELYLSKNRTIYYLEYGTGEPITPDNIDELPKSAGFFQNYFSVVIRGDYDKYKSFFTEEFFDNYEIPEQFTMQKIYDIEVNLFEKKIIDEDNKKITAETFIVKYKIMENNGTFRSDVGSNIISPLVFTLYNNGGNISINAIVHKINV